MPSDSGGTVSSFRLLIYTLSISTFAWILYILQFHSVEDTYPSTSYHLSDAFAAIMLGAHSVAPPSFVTSNLSECSIASRRETQIPRTIPVPKVINGQQNINCYYDWDAIPSGTFTYWLHHIEGKTKIKEKAFFADKYLVKAYVKQYVELYPQFNFVQVSDILYDCVNDTMPSYSEFMQLKAKYKSFFIKPNHYSGKLIMIRKSETISEQRYAQIKKETSEWLSSKYVKLQGTESWYKLVKPHLFIEEHIGIESNGSDIWNVMFKADAKGQLIDNAMIEYKICVINYKAVFLYIVKHPYLNNYALPEFKLLNVSWKYPFRADMHFDMPKNDNLKKMMLFAEHFAKREQFLFVRVDLYEINGKIYFSEFTFAPSGGNAIIHPIEFDYLLFDILCNNSESVVDRMHDFMVN